MTLKTTTLLLAFIALPSLRAADIHVVTSGAFTAGYQQLVPAYEQVTHDKLITAYGASTGSTPDTIPHRLERGEAIDVVIMASGPLEELIRAGKVRQGSRVDLVRSSIAAAVKSGAPRPDISSIDALKRTLLAARSVAYSGSASGIYLKNELFPRLGIEKEMRSKARAIEGEPVGAVVARGEAEIGFQQKSELLPVKGIDIIGLLPEAVQRVTIFAAAIPSTATDPAAAKRLIAWLSSPAAYNAIRQTGLEPAK